MFKTISAALIAVSVLAAPAFAATGKATQAPVVKTTPVKAGVLNANARMDKHHIRHARRHHHHNKFAAHRNHIKLSYKHSKHIVAKRG